jgi:hypothetical protein
MAVPLEAHIEGCDLESQEVQLIDLTLSVRMEFVVELQFGAVCSKRGHPLSPPPRVVNYDEEPR